MMSINYSNKLSNKLFLLIVFLIFICNNIHNINLVTYWSIQLAFPFIFYIYLFIYPLTNKSVVSLLNFIFLLNLLVMFISCNYLIDFIGAYEAPGFLFSYQLNFIFIPQMTVYLILNSLVHIVFNLQIIQRIYFFTLICLNLLLIIISVVLDELYFMQV